MTTKTRSLYQRLWFSVLLAVIAVAATVACQPDDATDGVDYHTEGSAPNQVLFAEFTIDDNLTKGTIRTGAQNKTVKILEHSKSEYPDVAKVFVQGTFPMQDNYGNQSDQMILNAGYDRATIDKINFDTVDPSKIWTLKDGGMVHSELGG